MLSILFDSMSFLSETVNIDIYMLFLQALHGAEEEAEAKPTAQLNIFPVYLVVLQGVSVFLVCTGASFSCADR